MSFMIQKTFEAVKFSFSIIHSLAICPFAHTKALILFL